VARVDHPPNELYGLMEVGSALENTY